MKKIISALVALAISVSIAPVTFADGGSITSNVDGKTITNVGDDATRLIRVNCGSSVTSKDGIKIYVGGDEVTNFEITPTDTGFTIDPMYFSTMDKTANTRNIYSTEENNCKIVVDGNEIDFKGKLILPIAYKNGYAIKNVSNGIAPYGRTQGKDKDGNTMYLVEGFDKRGMLTVLTDGVLYSGWGGIASLRWGTTADTYYEGGWKNGKSTFAAAGEVMFGIDLGAEYEIAGIAVSGATNTAGQNRSILAGVDNNRDTGNINGEGILGISDATYVGWHSADETVQNEVATTFSVPQGTKGRYIHVGTYGKMGGLDVSEIMVFAYVDFISEIKGTNLGTGENPVFGEKNIKLSFTKAVDVNAMKKAVRVTRADDKDVDFDVTADSSDKTAVWVKMTNFPDYDVDYTLTIAKDSYNSDYDYADYAALKAGAEYKFHNVQRTDLAVNSTVPSNGEEYGGRTLTVNFNGSVNLASAKQNISLTANNAALTEGTDYTVALDENDETILNIVFKGTMTADAEYALTIGAELNKGCIGYAIFPEGTQAQTFKFTYKQDSGSDSVEVSAEKMTDEALLALVDDSTNVSIVTDGEDKVIKWSETETTTEKSKEVEKTRTISLGKTIDLTKGPVSVEFTAKLAGCRSYMVIRNGGTAIAPHAGITTWGVTDAPRVKDFSRYPLNMPDGDTSQDGQWRTGTTVISKGSANSGYYTYKYVIDYNANTIEFYSKAEGDTDWSYPLVKSLELDGKTTYAKKVNGVYQYGVTPQTALDSVCLTTKYHSDDASNTADYCVKSIKVYQTTTPAVESQSVSDEATDISDTLRKITYNMTTEILESDVNKTNIKLYEVDHGEEKAFDDYTLQIHEDHKGFDILISADLGVDKEFRVKISGLTADTAAQGEMTTESVTNFETAKSFEVSEPTVTTSDAKVEVAGNVRTYHKSSGEGFMVLAVLMTKNNEFVACKYFIGTAADASSGFKNNSYGTFEFDKPADFDPANYKVRFFVFNGMQGSASIAKTFETPLAQ